MSSESDFVLSEEEPFDEEKHDQLLRDIEDMDEPKSRKRKVSKLVKKTAGKVDFNDLLSSIKSTRNVNELKKKLRDELDDSTMKADESLVEDKIQAVQQTKRRKKKKVLDAPLHRQAKNRIESEIAYGQSKRELNRWNPIVESLRVAEQLTFPLDEERTKILIESAADKAKNFTPKTELERKMAEMLGNSKFNLRNDEEFCEAEKEIIKAMDVKEARRKCSELRKMRALMSFRAAKFKRESKIKSKQYHRIRKRQKIRELVKELEELIVQDPEKAKERLKELEKDRAFERATLKHRGANKWNRHIKQFASRNPELRKLLDDHLRFGRELKKGHELGGDGMDSSSEDFSSEDEDDQKKRLTVDEIVDLAVEEANNDPTESIKTIETAQDNPFLRSALENIRRERRKVAKAAKKRGRNGVATAEVSSSASATAGFGDNPMELPIINGNLKRKLRKLDDARVRTEDKTEQSVSKKLKKKNITKGRVNVALEIASEENVNGDQFLSSIKQKQIGVENLPKRTLSKINIQNSKTRHQSPQNKKSAEENEGFLDINKRQIIQIPENLIDGAAADELNQDLQKDFMAEAYEDDDVLDDFREEKKRVEEEENPKDLDLTLHGWGSWTGPGIKDKKGDRFIIKAKPLKRKDATKKGLIIREKVSEGLAKLQPQDVPFPFTSIQDYEAFIQQPLGRDWNTPISQKLLIQPSIVTKAGMIIRPLDKAEKSRHKLMESDDED